jgi:predicted RNA-binding Zn-ribbon protein involved in translation (DUF1610 family)
MNTDNNDAVTQITREAVIEAMPFKCPKCPKRFTSKAGLTMHNMRVHTQNTGYKWKQSKSHNWDTSILEKQRLARRRAYQQKLRARYKTQGKDSRGYPKDTVDRNKWTPERMAKFQATMRKKALSKQRIQIVYPKPGETVTPDKVTSTIRFCPHCGNNLEKHL